MKVRVCDICGEQMNHDGEVKVKIKMRKKFWSWDYPAWIAYEMCNKCQKKMIEWVVRPDDSDNEREH